MNHNPPLLDVILIYRNRDTVKNVRKIISYFWLLRNALRPSQLVIVNNSNLKIVVVFVMMDITQLIMVKDVFQFPLIKTVWFGDPLHSEFPMMKIIVNYVNLDICWSTKCVRNGSTQWVNIVQSKKMMKLMERETM